MRLRVTKIVTVVASLSLLAVYIYLNVGKLETAWSDWADIRSGQPAAKVALLLSGEPVFQGFVKTSDIYDATGNRQVNVIHLPADVYTRVQQDVEMASLDVQEKKVAVSSTPDRQALLALTEGRKIYLLKEGDLKYMMTAIWNERIRGKNIIQCEDLQICNSVRISSKHWGPVIGPYPVSEINPVLRALPRGRWARGPRTVLSIQSSVRQDLWMKINLLGVFEDQVLRFSGDATQVRKIETDAAPLNTGGRLLYPAGYEVLLKLNPGANYLEVSYSKYAEPVREGANPLAAYVSAIVLKEAGS